MKVTHKVQILRTEEVTTDVLCNCCAKSMVVSREQRDCESPEKVEVYGLAEAKVSGGYRSSELEDGVCYAFSLCEACLAKMFDEFKIKPSVSCFWGGGEDLVDSKWATKEQKDTFEAYMSRLGEDWPNDADAPPKAD